MSKIQVLIRDAPTMLRDILEHAISNEPDMEAIPEPVVSTVAEAGRPRSPEVVVVGARDSDPAEHARALLKRWPESHVFVIAAGGHRVLLYELQPQGVDLGEMSPRQAVHAFRSAVRAERKPHLQ